MKSFPAPDIILSFPPAAFITIDSLELTVTVSLLSPDMNAST
ncbi:MAG: hypothetical protein PQ612_09640 [Rickettsiales bacterium]|nr:hypothetical protein [Pseudomonadota bacterium]MDA0966056.1 hypothetical protein [Pseudomonadota bacterium]MDG4544238.1 hypothetical protein [Rickettsiales bacterium]MDG4546417.1 hypothetical protein [Rickettsiales bacterium]MDG4548562.1 hypothetical protein [Rickettsiales bacterium]